jgi:hypothetical protein
MSGGHDDCRYLYADISEAARYVRNDIRREPEQTEFGDIRAPNSKALNMVYESIAEELERASVIYKSYDYCESGDKGEDDVWVESGKRLGNHSLWLSGGFYMSEPVLAYKDDDGIEQQKKYSSWEEYRSEVMIVKAQHEKPQTLYNLVNDKIVCTRL